MTRMEPVIARLLLNTHIDSGPYDAKRGQCWLWDGAVNKKGYGVIGLGGRSNPTALVHRVTYEFFIGPIPEGMTVDHLCEVKHCVRPAHMELVSAGENARRIFYRDGACRAAGHEVTPENTTAKGRCRACRDAYQTEYRNRKREAVAAD